MAAANSCFAVSDVVWIMSNGSRVKLAQVRSAVEQGNMQGSTQIELIADDHFTQLSSRAENLKDFFVCVDDVPDEMPNNVLENIRCSGSYVQQLHYELYKWRTVETTV